MLVCRLQLFNIARFSSFWLWASFRIDISNLDARHEIRASRLRLASAPRGALEWVALARSYTIAGLNDKAGRVPHERSPMKPSAGSNTGARDEHRN
jgi:hypothetical protein